jgi:hypothetical protein
MMACTGLRPAAAAASAASKARPPPATSSCTRPRTAANWSGESAAISARLRAESTGMLPATACSARHTRSSEASFCGGVRIEGV